VTRHLVLARHAEIGPEYAGQFVGSTDMPLSSQGKQQAAALAEAIAPLGDASLQASPMRRSVQTVEAFHSPWQGDDDLREIDFGRWEKRSFDEIAATEPAEQIEAWNRFDPDFAFPAGESLAGFLERIARVGDRLASAAQKTAIVVTHGGVIRALICHLLGLRMRDYVLFEVERASVTRIDVHDGQGVLVGLNDRSHLRESES